MLQIIMHRGIISEEILYRTTEKKYLSTQYMNQIQNKWIIETAWIMAAVFLALLVILPIRIYKIDFPYFSLNIFFVIGFVTFCRWLFLWKFTPYAWFKSGKLALIFIMIYVIFFGINQFGEFRAYLDDTGLQDLVAHLNEKEQNSLSLYIRSEMIFFATAFIFTSILIPFKMIRSIWRQYNRDEV
jgi:glucan phosphoethanolaminetransferase (alkaline phosphatase superfamily)